MARCEINSGIYIRVKSRNFEVPLSFYQLFNKAQDDYVDKDWDNLDIVLCSIRSLDDWFRAGTIIGKQGNLKGWAILHLRNHFD